VTVPSAAPNPIALFIHLGGLGDFVLSLRVVQRVAAVHGDLKCHVIGHAERAALAVGRSPIVRAWSAEGIGLHRLRMPDAVVNETLARLLVSSEVVVNFLGGTHDAFDQRLQSTVSGRVYAIDLPLRPDWPGHVTDQWLRALANAGLSGDVGPPRLTPTGSDRFAGQRLLAEQRLSPDRPMVVIHPGSGGIAKCWPVEMFLELASRLSQADCQPVFLLGPAEMERWPTEKRAALSAWPVLPPLGLEAVVQVMACAHAYVGNDSGITHLAAAMGTPTIAIFGPTHARHWGPLGAHVTVLQGSGEERDPFAGVAINDVTQAVLAAAERRHSVG
jgi:heptosyltransferase-3